MATLPTLDHARYMRRALALAARLPEVPFGAVIVDATSGEIVAQGWNRTDEHPLWHGELDALNALVRAGWPADPSRHVLYTTAEPCPMCQGAILWSGLGGVVFGTSIAYLQRAGWTQIGIPAGELVGRSPGLPCALRGGVLEAECNALFDAATRRRAAAGVP
jgi:tRNA(adenine34) deaminase